MKNVKISTKDEICTIMIDRPENRNAFTDDLAEELVKSFSDANRDAAVKCIILTGNPAGKAFCAGADLGGGGEQFKVDDSKKSVLKQSKRPWSLATHRDSGGTVGLAILNSTKPVICAMNGPAVGVGMTMACCCDMRVVVEDAKIGFPFVRRGLACETISSTILPRLISMSQAQEMVLTGRVIPANQAPAGLFNYLEKDLNAVMNKAQQLAVEIRDNSSPLSLALSRNMLIRNFNMSLEESHLIESKAIYACMNEKDNMEGIQSFLEKRKPRFVTDGWSSLPTFFPWWNPLDVKAKL